MQNLWFLNRLVWYEIKRNRMYKVTWNAHFGSSVKKISWSLWQKKKSWNHKSLWYLVFGMLILWNFDWRFFISQSWLGKFLCSRYFGKLRSFDIIKHLEIRWEYSFDWVPEIYAYTWSTPSSFNHKLNW